jgi:hypothetical protein
MSRKAIELVPINQVRSEQVSLAVKLPQVVDSSRIGVNVAGLERLSLLSGNKSLQIKTIGGEETKPAVPVVVGFNERGEAVAGKVAKTESITVHDVESDKHEIEELLFQRSKWRDTKIGLNVTEMSRLIVAETQWEGGVRSPEAWSHHLEQAIKQGIKDIGYQNLMNNASDFEKRSDISTIKNMLGGLALNTGLAYFMNGDLLLAVGISGVISSLIDILYLHQQRHRTTYIEPLMTLSHYPDVFRFSSTFGPEWERYLGLKHQLSRTPLVHQIDS